MGWTEPATVAKSATSEDLRPDPADWFHSSTATFQITDPTPIQLISKTFRFLIQTHKIILADGFWPFWPFWPLWILPLGEGQSCSGQLHGDLVLSVVQDINFRRLWDQIFLFCWNLMTKLYFFVYSHVDRKVFSASHICQTFTSRQGHFVGQLCQSIIGCNSSNFPTLSGCAFLLVSRHFKAKLFAFLLAPFFSHFHPNYNNPSL